jgi:hypothetical protein
MYPTDLPTPPDVRGSSPCPDCGSFFGHPDLAHGVPAFAADGTVGDTSLSGLLCMMGWVQRYLSGDVEEAPEGDPEYAADIIGQALARFRGQR